MATPRRPSAPAKQPEPPRAAPAAAAPLLPEATRDRIREVALDVFAQHGFEGTSTREICSRAGVNGAALNYHWRSKQALWETVCEQCGAWFGHIAAQIDLSAAPRDAIASFLRLVFDGLVQDPRPIRVVMWASMQPREEDTPGVARNFRPFVDFANAYVSAQKAQGKVRADIDTDVAVTLIHSMLSYTLVNVRGIHSMFGGDLRDPAIGSRVREAIVEASLQLLGLASEAPQVPVKGAPPEPARKGRRGK